MSLLFLSIAIYICWITLNWVSYVDVVFRNTKLVLILSGSSRRFIEEDILSRQSPLYGRRTEQMRLFPFATAEMSEMFPLWNVSDLASAYVITGGVPYYLSFLSRHEDIRSAIHDEFFLPGSSLLTEAELFMKGIYRKTSTYDAILSQLAGGTNEVSKISGKTGLSEANVSTALSSLAAQGIVARRERIAGHGIGRGWELIDGYFAFYYRYVYPYRSLIERGHGEAAFETAIEALDGFTAKGIEAVFREYVLSHSGLLITAIGSIDFPNPAMRRNEELDLFGQSNDGWIIGECKWQGHPVHRDVLDLLEVRTLLLVGGEKTHCSLLSKSGFSDDLIALSRDRDDIRLITGEELFGRQPSASS